MPELPDKNDIIKFLERDRDRQYRKVEELERNLRLSQLEATNLKALVKANEPTLKVYEQLIDVYSKYTAHLEEFNGMLKNS